MPAADVERREHFGRSDLHLRAGTPERLRHWPLAPMREGVERAAGNLNPVHLECGETPADEAEIFHDGDAPARARKLAGGDQPAHARADDNYIKDFFTPVHAAASAARLAGG